ncbi:hypothetical protein QP157_06845 [Sphingomonas sp. LR61]|uniref:hypothetical protein n=1 Tax=Sphingomonas sp. LR61 TaxID=3050234 RepID=UPI002FE24A27
MADFPVASEQFEDDPPAVTVALDQIRATPEWDGFTLTPTPARADELAAALSSKATACRDGRIDISYTDS